MRVAWRYALLSYLTPLAYATIAYALIWSFGLGAFPDSAALAAAAQKLGAPVISPSHFSYSLAFYLLLIGLGVVLPTLVTTLGEELGWRAAGIEQHLAMRDPACQSQRLCSSLFYTIDRTARHGHALCH